MIRTDVIIIGAGLLGCFTARNLMRYEADVTVLEQESDVCRGISKANTGIIYSGYDNKPGTDKQKLCVHACESFDRLCSELEVPFTRPGSLLISYGPEADEVIRRKYRDGLAGGVRGLRLLSGSEAEELEPALAGGVTSALLCQATGTVNPWELGIAAYENARDNGAKFVFGSRVVSVTRENGAFIVETTGETYHAAAVVNAAGLSSDAVREMTEKPLIRLYPTAADYIVLDRPAGGTVRHIIMHQGEDGKGMTAVPAVDGSLLLGPSNREPSVDETLARDMRTDRAGLDSIRELCGTVLPVVDLSLQIRTFGSMRPDAYYVTEEHGRVARDYRNIRDVRIIEEDGLFSLIGIKTPGLTIADALGRQAADRAASYAGITSINERFDPHRRAPVRARDLETGERAGLTRDDPLYGEIVCSCMDVTKAEVLQAVQGGARDFESVKRRTGAGMGKCQGSRCRKRVLDLLGTEGHL